MNKRAKKTIKAISILSIFLMALIALLYLIFFNKRETHTSNQSKNKIITSLNCTAKNTDKAFLISETANTTTDQIKITFSEDKIDKLFYSFEGLYNSNEAAEQDEAILHAKYNIYMGERSINPEILAPTFSTVDSKMKINLYAKSHEIINQNTGALFFIDNEEIEPFSNYTKNQIADFYEKKGFSCEEKANNLINKVEEEND